MTLTVELRIQSVLRNEDRDVKINLGELTTAVAGEHYELAENVTIPAGETSVIVPVKVYKKGFRAISKVDWLLSLLLEHPMISFRGSMGK